MKNIISFSIFCLLLINSCNKNPVGTIIVATENWHLIVDNYIQDSVNLTLFKMEDSSVSAQGKWVYTDFWGDEITCPVMSGHAIKEDSSLSINAAGTAYFPPDSLGVKESSTFSLKIDGVFNNGQTRGTWGIYFTNPEWVDSLSGNYTGTRRSGTGVTSGM